MGFYEFLVQYWPRLLSGTGVTLVQFLLAAAIGIAISLCMGLMKLSQNRLLHGAAVTYIEIFRGTSLVVQLYWIFFVLPLFGLTIEKFTAGYLAVGMNIGAYGAELVRGGILSVPKGQWEAALAINMSPAQRMRRIILPQALVSMLPPWGNLMIELLKGTALVSLISVADLMFESRQINASTFLSAQVFGAALVIYYVLARFFVTPFMRWLERHMARKMGRA
ncbi:ectoine/hydroxyectoine ABC transporter permease subunit EhuC [Leisingera sp. M527]|uniref:ectoine/hydroxyectoine ABC transporter permease subunit EhuC n=1 Tax=Leisingera sp. M523 TaxID=2867013 RepID=UPI0021A94DCF|nr:ectoine/hydroxyectoine ABC transporter permease subunit EhuC [Leisingera sp. M523]UWQ28326.1 ectoine/hydroxyectoine ABC transporter permease subunit EhuC [Leisingera sp. M523]UWQ33241.1 ectoine/hydroxyectoine ABC transporter permease subunit EhuC [Leisingera sp. M527]